MPNSTVVTDDELSSLRDEIERVDRAVIELIAERMQLARAIGAAKRDAGLPTLDNAREAAVVRHAVGLAREHGLDEEEIRKVFWQLIGMSRRAQQADA
jgi:chorismate mutase